MLSTTSTRPSFAAATTSITTMVAASMLMSPVQTTSSVGQITLTDPNALIWYANGGIDFSTSSSTTMAYEQAESPDGSAKFAAFEMFGDMRGSTQEERNLYEDMLARLSEPIDVDIFAI